MRRALVPIIAVSLLLIVLVVLLSGGSDRSRPADRSAAGSNGASVSGPEFDSDSWPLAGLNLSTYTRNGYDQPSARAGIARIAALGANAVTLTPTWYMDDGSSTRIAVHSGKTPSDRSVRQAMAWAVEQGLMPVLKPHVDVLDETFRGDIQPVDRDRWFRSYTGMITHYARLAAEQGAGLFVVGTELRTMSGHTEQWGSLIEQVRSIFPGRLTYAANWDEYRQVGFWSGLDLIGVDAYFPLAEGQTDPDTDTLVAAWEPVVEELQSFAREQNRPVLLTEVGYPSQSGAASHPWEVREDESADPDLQARAYRAVFEAFGGADWLAGINWWSWRADSLPAGDVELDWTPRNKPAERVLEEYWSAGSSG